MYICKNCRAHLRFEDKVCPACLRLNRQAEEERAAQELAEERAQLIAYRHDVRDQGRGTRGVLLAAALNIGAITALYLEPPREVYSTSDADYGVSMSHHKLSIPNVVSFHTMHPVLGPLMVKIAQSKAVVRSKFSAAYGGSPAQAVEF